MAYLKFHYKPLMDEPVEVELTPEVIKDIRQQLSSQVKNMPFGELVETIEATGLSVRNIIDLFKKVKEFGK